MISVSIIYIDKHFHALETFFTQNLLDGNLLSSSIDKAALLYVMDITKP